MMALRLAALAMLSACLTATAADAAPFCTQLKAIVADAPNGFDAFRSDKVRQAKSTVAPYGLIDYYAVKSWPEGAVACHLEVRNRPTADGNRYPNYYCEFPMKGADKGKLLRRTAKRVAACLSGVSPPAGQFDKSGGMLSWHANDGTVHFSAFAGPSNPNLRILIQSETR